MAHVDQVRGVLTWRVAEFLLNQARTLNSRSTVRLEAAFPREREYYLTLARGVMRHVDAVESMDPPSQAEIHRYECLKAMALARGRARLDASAHRHELDVFRPSFDRLAETAVCRHCGAGVSINLGTAAISASELLAEPCPSRNRSI